MNKKKFFTGNLSMELKKTIVKNVLWSVMLHASETWSLVNDSSRQKEIRSHGNVDLEKDGEN